MDIILDDIRYVKNFFPLTFNKTISSIKLGLFSFEERWKILTNCNVFIRTLELYGEKYQISDNKSILNINPLIFPDNNLLELIMSIKENTVILYNNIIIAYKGDYSNLRKFNNIIIDDVKIVQNKLDLFLLNSYAISYDIDLIKKNFNYNYPKNNIYKNKNNIFIEENVDICSSILNANDGPIYISKNTTIMECSIIKGPVYIAPNVTVSMNTRLFGGTTIDLGSKVGGEINNCIIGKNTNKVHDGFLGNSIIGDWCNIGAGTNNSNLKNNYSNISVWDYNYNSFINTNNQFCGIFMGDYTKCGIGTKFNSGSCIGISCNIFDNGFIHKKVDNFSWGGNSSNKFSSFDKIINSINNMMQRRSKKLEEIDIQILQYLYINEYS